MKRILLCLFFNIVGVLSAFADGEVNINVNAPTIVTVGEHFKVEFNINAKVTDFKMPFSDVFQILAGPMVATTSNLSVTNGQVEKQQLSTYTYILQANEEGVKTIPSVEVTVKNKKYSSQPFLIEVIAAEGNDNNSSVQQDDSQAQTQQNNSNATQEILLRAEVDKKNPYKGEAVKVTLKLYHKASVAAVSYAKLPTYNGFWREDLPPNNRPPQREKIGDKVYDSAILHEVLLYPQQTGTLTIDPFEIEVVSYVQNGNGRRSMFDQMMGVSGYDEVRRKVTSKPVKIDVKELPAGAPASFNGAVGQLAMDVTHPANNINANSSNTYTIKISGTGNLPLVRAPKIEFPTTFEEYNIKTTESFRNTANGTTGYRQFEYPFIPRSEGAFTIPELKFSYFDPKRSQYVTLAAKEITLSVAADSTAINMNHGGIVSGMTKEDLKILGHDIRYIKMSAPKLRPQGQLLMLSPLYFGIMALALIVFFVALFMLKRHITNMQNDTFVRGKRANKVALKRLRNAEGAMRQDDRQRFYDEMLKAMWGYMSDKLNIPMARLTKDMIREVLFERTVPEAQAGDYVRIISACEEAQYSPTSSAQMNELYRSAVNLISDIESAIKK